LRLQPNGATATIMVATTITLPSFIEACRPKAEPREHTIEASPFPRAPRWGPFLPCTTVEWDVGPRGWAVRPPDPRDARPRSRDDARRTPRGVARIGGAERQSLEFNPPGPAAIYGDCRPAGGPPGFG